MKKAVLVTLFLTSLGVSWLAADYSIELIPPLGYTLDDAPADPAADSSEIPFATGFLLGVTYDSPRRFDLGAAPTGLRVGVIGGFTHLNTVTYDAAGSATDLSVAYMSLPVMAYGEVWTEGGLFGGIGLGIHTAMVRAVAGSNAESETDVAFAALYRAGYQIPVRPDLDLRLGAWINWLPFPAATAEGDNLNFITLAVTIGVAFRR